MPESTFYSHQTNADLLRLVNEQYLVECGWLESILSRRPQRNGLPIPWFTFSAVDYLETLDLVGKRVLEIGSGFSTLYWGRRGLVGHSLECDEAYYETVKNKLQGDGFSSKLKIVKIVCGEEWPRPDIQEFLEKTWLAELTDRIGQKYLEETEEFFVSRSNLYHHLTKNLPLSDLVIIDGVARNICLMLAASLVPQNALIILDNSDRLEYAVGQEFLTARGWKAMRFKGLGPINPYEWETTIFFARKVTINCI